jgi:hypothetical protein
MENMNNFNPQTLIPNLFNLTFVANWMHLLQKTVVEQTKLDVHLIVSVCQCLKTFKSMLVIEHNREHIQKNMLQAILKHSKRVNINNNVKRIPIWFAGKGLINNDQIQSRMSRNNFTVWTLSSHKNATFDSKAKLLDAIQNVRTCEDGSLKFPDAIVVCTHPKRVNDMLAIIKSGETINDNFRVVKTNQIVEFDIFIDECDDNLSALDTMLKNSYGNNIKSSVLKNLYLITATPYDKFWKMMAKYGITELQPEYFENDPAFQCLSTGEYRKVEEHIHKDIRFKHGSKEENTVDYAEEAFKHIEKKKLASNVIYAPAGNSVKSHWDMKEFFVKKGYHVYVQNGADWGKSFHYMDNNNVRCRVKMEDYCSHMKIDKTDSGEISYVMAHYMKTRGVKNIAVTGWNIVGRGITWNTKIFDENEKMTMQFQLKDCIFSNYHGKNPVKRDQDCFGRSVGQKKYCDICTIWCPKNMWLAATEMNNKVANIVKSLPETIKHDAEQFKTEKEKKKDNKKRKRVENIGEKTFRDLASVLDFIESIGLRRKTHANNLKKKLRPDGFYYHVEEQVKGSAKKEIIHKAHNPDGKLNAKLHQLDSGRNVRIIPLYTDVNDPNTLIFNVRWNKTKEKKRKMEKKLKAAVGTQPPTPPLKLF